MDIWFWVNDWWSWVTIYLTLSAIGGITCSRTHSKYVLQHSGDLHAEINWGEFWAGFGLWFLWLPMIYIPARLAAKSNNVVAARILVGPVPKELKEQSEEKKLDKLLEPSEVK